MIGQTVTDPKTGEPVSGNGTKLAKSKYQPQMAARDLFVRVQRDYQTAFSLQRKPLDEFDGMSLLDRAKLDQETFAAFVGMEYQAKTQRWRWKGRKNTARNKLIGILAHLIVGMLYPYVNAQNDKDEEDKMTARVMRILVEEKLRNAGPYKAGYEVKFFYMVLSALVNPASFIHIEFVQALQMIRQRRMDGEITIKYAFNEALSGLMMHILPIDEILLGDFYVGTGNIQGQPFIFRVRRLSYDTARSMYAKKHFMDGVDLFDYVEAGATKVMTAAGDDVMLFDVEMDEGEKNFVQELTVYYLGDDLELTWVGGVGMFDHQRPYDNPFKHRRMAKDTDGEWCTVPVYPFAMGGFEPADPSGRFVYFKSGAFKEFWEDKKITELDRMLVDGVKLDIFKPMFLSGVAKVDSAVMVPGATVAMPTGATATPYQLGPNLVAAYQQIVEASKDMAESTQDKIMSGNTEKGITATQTLEAKTNARIFLGVFGFMVANTVKQVGELVMDCVIMYDTIGDVEGYADGRIATAFKTILARGKERGKNITNKVVFSDKYMGVPVSKERAKEIEWDLYKKTGKEGSDQRIYEVNPYQFARHKYSMYIDADQIVAKSMGMDRAEKDMAFEKLMDPRVMPFIDPETVVDDFVLEEYSDGDPDRYKKKQGQDELIQALLGQAGQGQPAQSASLPINQ